MTSDVGTLEVDGYALSHQMRALASVRPCLFGAKASHQTIEDVDVRRVGHPLTLEQVIAIIDALCAEAESKQKAVAFSNNEVVFYLMDGLYEELLGEPSSIFSSTSLADGVVRFEPLQREFWLRCLQVLRHRLERLGLSAE